MTRNAHLDRVEKLMELVEVKRKRTNLSQDELATRGGISKSHYSQLANLPAQRERLGDDDKRLNAPRDIIASLKEVPRVLSEELGEDFVEELQRFWTELGGRLLSASHVSISEREILMGQLVTRSSRLTQDKLETLVRAVDHMTSV